MKRLLCAIAGLALSASALATVGVVYLHGGWGGTVAVGPAAVLVVPATNGVLCVSDTIQNTSTVAVAVWKGVTNAAVAAASAQYVIEPGGKLKTDPGERYAGQWSGQSADGVSTGAVIWARENGTE